MRLLRHLFLTALSLTLWSQAGIVSAQNYPTKPVRIVTTDAGGSSDFFLRAFAADLTRVFGQSFVIENRGGSGGVPGEVVSKAAPDGYTLLFFTSNLWITPLLQKTNYNPLTDFAPITLASQACSVLVVTPSLPAKNVKDIIALARSHPGDLVYAHGSAGSASHLAGAMFRHLTNTKMLNVPYKGSSQALIDVMAGRAQLMFPNSAVVPPLMKSGKVRALAVTTPTRSPLFPDLPAVAETVPGFNSGTVNGFLAPAKTPEAIIKRLNEEAVRFIRSADAKEKLASGGIETVGSTPQEFANFIAQDSARWAQVIKAANIKADE